MKSKVVLLSSFYPCLPTTQDGSFRTPSALLASLEMKNVGSMEKSILEFCWNWSLLYGELILSWLGNEFNLPLIHIADDP